MAPPVRIRKPLIKILKTQEYIAEIERLTGTKTIIYYVASSYSIRDDHPELFLEMLRKIGKQQKINLVLISHGGSPFAAYRIASLLRDFCDELQIMIPSIAASAATILSLSANKIIMTSSGYLTAIDPSFTTPLNPQGADGQPVSVAADQIQRVIDLLRKEGPVEGPEGFKEGEYRTLFKYVHPLVLGHVDRGASSSELIANKVMKMHLHNFQNNEENVSRIANHLVKNYPSHGFPILFNEAKEIGLPVEKAEEELSDVLWNLVKTFNQISLPFTTYLHENFYHFEGYPVIIETSGLRTSNLNSYNRRFNSATRRWQVENDITQWVNIIPPTSPNEKARIIPIDSEVQKQAENPLPVSPDLVGIKDNMGTANPQTPNQPSEH